jgi:hypothetical protein
MVGAAGLEPATLCLEGRCSIHLSYAPVVEPLLILNHFLNLRTCAGGQIGPKSPRPWQNRDKTHQLGLSVSKPGRSSFAFRFSFSKASRFICSFIWEYFLNILASPCRNCVTHSSATPPALKRVA